MQSAVATPELSEATDERLLAVAERLFAAKGIEAVSIRAITIEADANVAAVHYHFGTKLDLVRALVERRVGEVNRARLELLRDVTRQANVSAHDVARVWVEPLAECALDPARQAYLGFVVALHNSTPELRAVAADAFRPHFGRLDALAARALPHLDAPVRRFRFGLVVDTSLRALARLDELASPWRSTRLEIAPGELIAEITAACAGLLLADDGPCDGATNTTNRTNGRIVP